jgi:hypothetical protein
MRKIGERQSYKRKDSINCGFIYAEVVTFVAGILEAGGLPGYPEVF